jgi:hypothetical protein
MIRLLAALLYVALAAPAQDAGAVSVIDAVVMDASGHPAPGLTPADFEVTAGGKTVQPIRLSYLDATRNTAVTPTKLPALELTPGQIHRTIVIVIDDLCLSSAALQDARARLRQFIEQLLPGDQTAILRTSGGSNQARPMTANHARLLETIEDTQYLGGSISREACAAAAWTAVGYAVNGLATLSGRKAVVLMSGELRSPTGNSGAAIQRIAADSMTAIYTVSAAPSIFAGATSGASGVDLDQVLAETAAYYVLAFPSAGKDVQVKVLRPGLTLRVRATPAGLARQSNSPAPGEPLTDVVNSPFEGAGIGVRVTPIFNNDAAHGAVIDMLCHIEARDLGSLRDAQGRYHMAFQIGATTVIEGGGASRLFLRDHELNLSEVEYRQAMEQGLNVNFRLSWGSGPRDVRVVVADQRSGRTGSASAFVQVHDLASGAFFLSSILAQGDARPRQAAAVRMFREGETVSFVYHIYNAATDSAGAARVQLQSRLFARGQEVFSGTPSTVEFPPARDTQRRQVTGHYQLGASLRPGRYIFAVTVTDMLSPQPRTAGQFIDFTVEP